MRYLDTSSLVTLYYPEEKSGSLVAHLQRKPMPLAFTALHEVEFTNALQLKLFRKQASADAVSGTLDFVRNDLEDGVLRQVQLPWPTVFSTTLRLSLAHARSLGTRTLDLLHIAAALAAETTEFITADDRQAKAAAKSGLKVVRF